MNKKLCVVSALILVVLCLGGCGNKGGDTGVAAPSAEKKTATTSIPQMTLNEPFLVETDNGNYALTMESARATDERNNYSDMEVEKVVYLEYSYENQTFGAQNGMDLRIDQEAFQVMDDSGNMLTTYANFDQNRRIMDTPSGAKCKASIAYGLPVDSQNLKVNFVRGENQKVGQIIIPIT